MISIIIKLIISYEISREFCANFGVDLIIPSDASASLIHDKIIEAIKADVIEMSKDEHNMMNLRILSICQINTSY